MCHWGFALFMYLEMLNLGVMLLENLKLYVVKIRTYKDIKRLQIHVKDTTLWVIWTILNKSASFCIVDFISIAINEKIKLVNIFYSISPFLLK